MNQPRLDNSGTSYPSTVEDYRSAISKLESSTTFIEAHIKNAQNLLGTTKSHTSQSILTESKTGEGATHDPQNGQKHQQRSVIPPTSSTIDPKQRRAQLSSQITSLNSALKQSLSTTSSALTKATGATLIEIDDTLSRHDHTFSELDAVLAANYGSVSANVLRGQRDEDVYSNGTALRDQDDIYEEHQGRAQKLLDALEGTEIDVIRTRLERVFLETLRSSTASEVDKNAGRPTTGATTANGHRAFRFPALPQHEDEEDDDNDRSEITIKADVIRQDLDTLNAEIPSVASMFVAHEHGDRLVGIHDRVLATREVLNARQTIWGLSLIQGMHERNEMLREKAIGLYGYRLLIGRLREEIAQVGVGIHGPAAIARKEDDIGIEHLGRSSTGGPALVGLRSYMGGVGNPPSGQKRINDLFADLQHSVEKDLEIQAEQAVMLNSREQVQQGEEAGTNLVGSQHSEFVSLLDDLDGEIAKIKLAIEQLPA